MANDRKPGSSFEEPDERGREIIKVLSIGRENAISVGALARRLSGPNLFQRWSDSTVRLEIVRLQELDISVLTSPRAGVWLAASHDEILDVMDEMRDAVAAIERRMQAINGGRCALRSCREKLPENVVRRGGLYCKPDHRYQAAAERDARVVS